MQKIIFYAAALLCLFASKAFAQETFEQRAKAIAQRIEAITKEEKDALKEEVEVVNKRLDNGEISQEEADSQKATLADTRAKNIEERVGTEEAKLTALVKEKVDGKLPPERRKTAFSIYWDSWDKDSKKRDSIVRTRSESRTTSQFVFAFGLNNALTEGDLSSVEGSDYRVWGSHFYEWGITFNTRLAKNHNLLHAKYGLSLMYNNLRPTDNRNFVVNGDQTNLVTNPINLKDSRFRNVYLVVPVHLEFDFTKKRVTEKRTYFHSHESFRFGIGGYGGVNVKSKQILRYEIDNHNVKERSKGDFNVNDFIYGLSAYIGYGEISLYAKYDLNTIFRDNPVDQNNISVGIRFDLN
ncbi:hypothetical protein MH928_00970 [Flavobacterium sp. WW92]|uniref:hypothetical protein n=1 Tax=unclassified Flavobacterium TaxID=196869 RepID=UPI002224A1C4|nr:MULTISPECIES: hypothetical protein [unclassified Flavobacterium]WDO13288.1 hypothetical protein MH928_00970 [Flavobacterium sp. WW92]